MGTPMPMKLPSGQVVWVRVSDDGHGDEGEDAYEDEGGPGPYSSGGGYGSGGYGSGGYGAAPGGGYGSAPGGYEPAPGGGYGSGPGGYGGHDDAEPTQQPYGSGYPPPPYVPQQAGPTSAPPARQHGRFGLRKRKTAPPDMDAPQQLHGFTDAVSGIAESVRAGLNRAAPDTVEIEFGLDIDVTSGVAISLIADARAKAAVRIKLGWENAPAERHGASEGDDAGYPEIEAALSGDATTVLMTGEQQ